MTSKSDERRCWGRIRNYIRAHSLPDNRWEFVGFIASMEAQKLEVLIHRKLSKFRVMKRKGPSEFFKCSIEVYMVAQRALC